MLVKRFSCLTLAASAALLVASPSALGAIDAFGREIPRQYTDPTPGVVQPPARFMPRDAVVVPMYFVGTPDAPAPKLPDGTIDWSRSLVGSSQGAAALRSQEQSPKSRKRSHQAIEVCADAWVTLRDNGTRLGYWNIYAVSRGPQYWFYQTAVTTTIRNLPNSWSVPKFFDGNLGGRSDWLEDWQVTVPTVGTYFVTVPTFSYVPKSGGVCSAVPGAIRSNNVYIN